MIDTLTKNPEYEQHPNREVERKYVPIFPEELERFREQAVPVEQYYLSHWSERFTLRLRETISDGELRYSATIKDEGTLTAEGLDRLEEETDVSAETYTKYKTDDVPILRKLRAAPAPHIAIDFFEDGHVQLEAEDPIAWTRFTEQYDLTDRTMEVSGDTQANNEWRAHLLHRRNHGGREALVPAPELDIDDTVRQIVEAYRASPGVPVRVGGRSGSGKSTIIREIEAQLHERGITSAVLSTDDYNVGRRALTERFGDDFNWDMKEVYDTERLAGDIERLRRGEIIDRKAYDFATGEPYTNGHIEPAGVYLIEGLYALSDDFEKLGGITIEVPTSIAECTGRRLHRDHHSGERDVSAAFPTAADSLRYILEVAEPAYRAQRT